ncbi:DUF6232 family protein [Methylophilus flavus]|uniref:DUF6232 family protein n=1 Tax=Methylophilus flavus TaxID=640084 RepID=A0ABW3PHK4_9PROT
MEDSIYFSHLGVIISYSQLIVNGKAISLKSITSIEPKMLKRPLGFARVSLFGGLALLFASGFGPPIGLLSIVFSGLLWHLAKPKYSIVIHTPTGDHQAILSEDFLDMESVMTAVNVAISLRGSPQLMIN